MNKVLDHKCLACGSKIEFNPKTQKWNCNHCNSVFKLDDFKEVNYKNSLKEFDTYICPDCGAEIIADKNTVATFCIYCGNTAIIKNKLSGEFHPDGIIPFTVTKEEAKEVFTENMKNTLLSSSSFLKEFNIEKVTGVYVPFWINNLEVDVKFQGTGFKTGKIIPGTTNVSQEQYAIIRHNKIYFEDVPIDGSLKLDNTIMFNIFPYDLNKMKEYHHAYLTGFFAERYDDDKEKLLLSLKEKCYKSTDKAIRDIVNIYDGFNLIEKEQKIETITSKYVLLPVYMINVKYKDQIYPFIMNGQTKEFVGDIPISGYKTSGLFLALLSFLCLIMYIFFELNIGNFIVALFISLIFIFVLLEKHNTVKPFINLDKFYDFKKVRHLKKDDKLINIINK